MATKLIGGTIRLEGEKEFQRAVSNCNKSLKEMQSAMKLVKSQTADSANSLSSLEKRHEALKNVLEAQTQKQQALQKALKGAKEDYSDTGLAVKDFRERVNDAKDKLKEMQESGEASEKELESQKAKIKELSQELQTQESEYEKAGNRVKEWQTKVNNAETEIEKTNRELEENTSLMEEAKKYTDECARSIDRFGNSVKQSDTELSQHQLQLQKANVWNIVQQNVEKAAAAFRTLGVEILEVTNSYENGFAKVSTIADAGAVPLDELKNSMLQLSTETGRGIDEITEATYQAISASVDTADAVNFVKSATNLAKAGFLETAGSVDVLTTIINAYKLSADDTEAISDKLVQTQNRGKTTVNELSQSMGQVIPLAAAYNVNLDNLATAYVELTKNGIGTAEAGTMLKGMFSELAKDGSTVSDVLHEMAGKSFGEMMKEGASLGDVLDLLYKSVEGNSEAFANLWGNVRARTGALSLAQTGAAEFNGELEAMASSTGNVAEALEKLNTPSAKANRAMNALKNSGAILGDAFMEAAAPALEAAAKAAQEIAKRIGELPPSVKTAVGVLGGLLTVSAGLVPKIIAVANSIKGIKAASEAAKAVKALRAAMAAQTAATEGATAAQEGLNAAQAANPIGIVVLAIAGLAAALWGLDKAYKAAQAAANPYHEELVDLKVRHEELQEEIGATKSKFDEAMNASGVGSTLATNLKNELEELMAVEEKDTATKEKIKTVVNELNETVPGLALAYDSEADSLNKTNAQIEQSIELMEQQLRLEAYREGWLEALQQQAQAEKDLAEAKALVLKMTEGASDETRNALETYIAQNNSLYQSAGLWSRLNEEIGQGKWQAEELTEAVRLLNSAEDDYNDITQQCEWYSEQYGDSLENVGDAAQQAADDTEEMSAAALEAAAEVEEATETLEEAYAKLYQSAYDSIHSQVGLFDELKTETETSLEQMNQALISQQEGIAEYSGNIDAAMQYVASSGNESAMAFVQSIADMGLDGAAYMAEFVKAIEANDGSAEEILKNFAGAEAAKANWAAQMAQMDLITQQETSAMVKSIEDAKGSVSQASAENAQAAVEEVEKTKSEHSQAGQENAEAYAGGISAGSGSVKTAAGGVLSNVSSQWTNTSAFSWGAEMGSQFAAGITSQKPAVAAAAADVAQAAADYLHHSTPDKGALHGDDKWGDELTKNIAKGMNRQTGEVTKSAKKMADVIAKTIKGLKLGNYGTAVYTKTAEDRIDAMTKVNALTLTKEQEFWEAVVKRTKKGTSEYKTAVKALNSVKKELRNETASITRSYAHDVQAAAKELKAKVKEVNQTLKSDTKSVRAEMKRNAKDLRMAYKEAVTARKEAITGALNLFDSESIRQSAAYSKKSYTEILRQQVNQLREWDATLTSLRSKISNKGLLEELEGMGVDQIAALKTFDSMSKKELQKYEDLYKQRETIANRRAKNENAELKKETEAQIEELKAAAAKEIKALNSAAAKEIKALQKTTGRELKALKKEYLKNLKELGVDGSKQGKAVGKQVALGINAGFKAYMKTTNAAIRKQMKQTLKEIKAELKINSPSGVLKEEVGANMAGGIGAGFVDEMKIVERKMLEAIPTSFDTSPAFGSGAQAAGADSSGRVVVENRIYLDGKDITSLLTKKIVRQITTDMQNSRLAKGVAYV